MEENIVAARPAVSIDATRASTVRLAGSVLEVLTYLPGLLLSLAPLVLRGILDLAVPIIGLLLVRLP